MQADGQSYSKQESKFSNTICRSRASTDSASPEGAFNLPVHDIPLTPMTTLDRGVVPHARITAKRNRNTETRSRVRASLDYGRLKRAHCEDRGFASWRCWAKICPSVTHHRKPGGGAHLTAYRYGIGHRSFAFVSLQRQHVRQFPMGNR